MKAFTKKTEDFPKYYTTLFNAMTNAIEALDAMNPGEARVLLIQGQRAEEDAFLSAREEILRT